MKPIKQWRLTVFDQQDLEYIASVGCPYEANWSQPIEMTTNGKVWRYQGPGGDVLITTENEEQESKILLKFGGKIHLMSVMYTHIEPLAWR